uniref:tail fiber domain-containing protein n=1 Tax=Chitinophaga sp. TaxID=1869181 RepID=UPI00262898D8
FTTSTAAPIEAMRLDETGKLGIGGVSPSQMLDVNGNILSRGIVLTEKLTSGNSDSRLSIYGGGAKYGGQILLYGGGLNRGFMTFHTGVGDALQPERMRITNTGRVGIGTPYPSAKLSIGGADLIGEIGRIGFDIDSSQRAYIGAYRHTAIGQGTDLYFGTMGVERLRITNTGRIGIGTDAPSFPIHMSGLNTAGMAIQNTGELSTSSGAYFRLYNSGMPSAAGQRLGAVLYGANTTGTTYEAGAQIDAVTEGAWTSASQPTAIVFNTTPLNAKGVQEKMRLSAAGNLTVSGNVTATAFYQTSRRELKTDIQAFDHSALDVFRNAQVRTFRFKADRSREHIGFIADELPGEMAAPGTTGVDQGNTVALLVKAVQELEAKNKALEDKLETLETMIREIKAKQ